MSRCTVVFGGISKDKACQICFEVRAGDGRHFLEWIKMDKEKVGLHLVSPGNFQLKAGLDNKAGTTIYIEAENGDVVIKSLMVILDLKQQKRLNLYARKNIMMEANAQMDINSNNINVDARFCMKIKATSFLTINAPCGMEILSNIIRGVSCASGRSNLIFNF